MGPAAVLDGARSRVQGKAVELALGAVVVAGAALRVWGLTYGLPCTYCRPDESTVVHKALLAASGQLDPRFYNYPALAFYVVGLLYGVYYVSGRALGLFGAPLDVVRGLLVDPSPFYLIARAVSVASGCAAIAVTNAIGRRLGGPVAGLCAAAFLAVCHLHVRVSHFATVDTPATLLAAVSMLYAVHYAQQPRRANLAGCGLALGLATATKYSSALFAAAPVVVALRRSGDAASSERLRSLGCLAVTAGLGFVTAAPFSLLNAWGFWRDVAYEASHFSTGHAGMRLGFGGWQYHLVFVLRYGLGIPLLALSLCGLLVCLVRRHDADTALLAAAASYYCVLGIGENGFARYALPLVPLLCVAAGDVCGRCWRRCRTLSVGLAILAAGPTLADSVVLDRLLSRTDTRLAAGRWMVQHLPTGAKVAMLGSEYGFPWVPRSESWHRDALREARARGDAGTRLAAALETGATAASSFYVIQLLPHAPRDGLTVRSGSVDALRSEGVEWAVTHSYPLPYSEPDPDWRLPGEILEQGTVALCVDPFTPARSERARFDRFDAFYLPYAGLDAVERPGPRIQVWRLDHRSAGVADGEKR